MRDGSSSHRSPAFAPARRVLAGASGAAHSGQLRGRHDVEVPRGLRVYEHLLWQAQPDAVVELGVQFGGSALWWRDRMAALRRYGHRGGTVVAVELDPGAAIEALDRADPAWRESIELIAGDVHDPELPGRVGRHLGSGARCLVVEDTAHVYETTWAALEGFHSFVAPGGSFVVEDGCVDDDALRISPDWPRGVRPAIDNWLETSDGRAFEARRDLELYGVTCHPSGFLQRRAPVEP
ncbi:MAG: CmcI family methyltransferase [Solirubrobacteraceae bacterium]